MPTTRSDIRALAARNVRAIDWQCFEIVHRPTCSFVGYVARRWEDVRALYDIPPAELESLKPHLVNEYDEACLSHAIRMLNP